MLEPPGDAVIRDEGGDNIGRCDDVRQHCATHQHERLRHHQIRDGAASHLSVSFTSSSNLMIDTGRDRFGSSAVMGNDAFVDLIHSPHCEHHYTCEGNTATMGPNTAKKDVPVCQKSGQCQFPQLWWVPRVRFRRVDQTGREQHVEMRCDAPVLQIDQISSQTLGAQPS